MSDQLMARIEELLSLNESLLEATFRKGLEHEWETDAYGMSAITNEQHYANYKRKQYRNILDYRAVPVNEEKINRLLDIRFKRIERAFENLNDEGAFGTILNIAYLLPESIYSHLERNAVKDALPLVLPLKSETERTVLSLALMDSFTNSEILMDEERDILTRLYHRLRGDEASLYEEE